MLKTLGHACLVVYREGENPLLVTDPWLVGSVYWRSWWLENYPSADEIDWLAKASFVYVTHEHPDHFHMPTIRRLGDGPTYLFPSLAERGYLDHMSRHGFRAEAVVPLQWRAIRQGISILSIPVWNDDSLLLINTPSALILDINDAKPLAPVLRAIRRLADRIGKPRILLCSYSPASLVNSFVDDSGIVSLKPSRHYVDYVGRLCDTLAADFYIPFASQAVFNRTDSLWANDFRTTYRHLRQYWRSRTQLLPPYATLDLAAFTHCATAPGKYRTADQSRVARITQCRSAKEEAATPSAQHIASLQRKLNAFHWLFWLMFPRGFALQFGEILFEYDTWRGRIVDGKPSRGRQGDFIVAVPKLTIKEAIENDHVSDLGITMFVRIRLLRRIDPRKIYALFVLLQIDDYGHLKNSAALLRWLWRGVRFTFALRLPVSPPSLARQ